MPKQVLDISTSSIIRVFAVLLLIGFLFSIWQILASIFMAVVISAVAEPGISFLTRLRLHRFIAAMLVYLAGIGIVASAFFLVIPTLVVESRQISTDLPVAYEQLVNDIEIFFGNEPSEINAGEHFRSLFGNFQQGIGGIGSNIFSITFGLFGGLISVILVFVISFYLAMQKDGVERFLRSFIPMTSHQEYIVDLWKRVQKKLGRWFQGQILLGVFIGVLLFLAFWLMGINYALSIAFMAGIFEIIPVIGPLTAALIAFVLISFQSPMLAFSAMIVYLLIEQLQNNLVLPPVMAKTTGLNPVVIIVAILVGVKLIGIWGIILAIPLSVTVAEFVKDLKK